MMGDRDFRSVIQNTVVSIGEELKTQIDAEDVQTIHLQEVVQCLRRSYYDRTDPVVVDAKSFSEMLPGLIRRLQHGSEPREFAIEDIKLRGQSDMIVDDEIILLRPAVSDEMENPLSNDALYLNACLWIYDKPGGMIVYVTGDKKEMIFTLTRDKKMFEETIRRVRVLNDLLKEQKTPILEPSEACSECQYYERCFSKQRNTKGALNLAEMLGIGSKD